MRQLKTRVSPSPHPPRRSKLSTRPRHRWASNIASLGPMPPLRRHHRGTFDLNVPGIDARSRAPGAAVCALDRARVGVHFWKEPIGPRVALETEMWVCVRQRRRPNGLVQPSTWHRLLGTPLAWKPSATWRRPHSSGPAESRGHSVFRETRQNNQSHSRTPRSRRPTETPNSEWSNRPRCRTSTG
jgi:hypothetical protein